MKKFVFLSALVLVLATAGLAQNLPRFELSLYGGYGIKNVNTGSEYYDAWTGSYYYLDSIGSESYFAATSKGGLNFGGGLAFYFHPNIGIGFNFGYFKTAVTSVTDSNMWWSWTSTSSTYYAYDDILDDPLTFTGMDNYFQTIPLSLNFIGRFGTERFQGYFSAGPTLYMNKLFVESEIAYSLLGGNWGYFAVDVIMVPTEIRESWQSFGADFGAGFTFWLAPSFGIFFDGRYYLSGKKVFDWAYYEDTYDGLFGNFIYPFDSADIDYLYENELITGVEINPSFLQLAFGFKIRLM